MIVLGTMALLFLLEVALICTAKLLAKGDEENGKT